MAFATFVPLLWSGFAAVVEGRIAFVAGALGALLAAVTVYCTAMIYASLRSVEAWHTRLTPLCYLLFAAAGGALAAAFAAVAAGQPARPLLVLALALLVAAWTAKAFWRRRLARPGQGSTPETATGLGAIGRVRLFERPHSTENYLTREMGFRVARKHAAKLARLALLFGRHRARTGTAGRPRRRWRGAGGGAAGGWRCFPTSLGMLAERWLFFAEARHAVMNYYGG